MVNRIDAVFGNMDNTGEDEDGANGGCHVSVMAPSSDNLLFVGRATRTKRLQKLMELGESCKTTMELLSMSPAELFDALNDEGGGAHAHSDQSSTEAAEEEAAIKTEKARAHERAKLDYDASPISVRRNSSKRGDDSPGVRIAGLSAAVEDAPARPTHGVMQYILRMPPGTLLDVVSSSKGELSSTKRWARPRPLPRPKAPCISNLHQLNTLYLCEIKRGQ